MNLRSDKRQNIQGKLDFSSPGPGEAQEPGGKEIESLPAAHEHESPASTNRMMEEICDWENLKEAMWRVKANKGSAGIDGMRVEELPDYAALLVIREQLLSGSYTPQPVKRVKIPKPDGGVRKLGIPTALDRFVQQAVMQVLQRQWNPTFSDSSYGFRPGRSTHQAVAQAQQYIAAGYGWVVDLDLEKFFDRVNHDKLMGQIAKRVEDKRLLKLIRAFLNAGVMENGLVSPSVEGTPQGGPITPLTQKVTLAVWPTWRRTAVLWGARWDWDTVANGDGVVSHQDVFDYESYDSLALRDVQRLGSTAQAGEERRESLRQSREGCPIVGLVSDRLQLSTKHLFTLAQRRHALAQLLDRQERFLVGVEKSFHAFANMRQLPLQTLLTFLGRIARACGCQPAVQFLLEQRRVFQQSDHLRPNDLIEEILSDQAAVVANRTAKFSPAIGTNTFVVVDLARARACRYAREGVAALLTADQPLHDTRLDGATARSYFVLLEKLLGTSEAILAYQGGHGDLDPLFARALVACCRAGRHHTPPTQRANHARPCRHARLAEAGEAAIRRVAQYGPDGRAFPAGACLARRDAFGVDPAGHLADAESLHRVHLIYALHHPSLGFKHGVRGGRLVGLADIAVAIRSAAHHADLARVGPVSLTATRSLQDLRPLIFGDHALELHQQLIFRAGALRRFNKQRLDSLAGELLDQQDLVCVLAAQAIRRVREHNLDLPFGGKVPHTLQARALERRSTIAFIFEDPLFGHVQIVGLGKLDQRRRLARDRVLLALLLRRDPCVDCRHPQHRTPLHAHRRAAPDGAPEYRRPGRASTRAGDQTHNRRGFEARRFLRAAQPCFFRAPRNAFNARVTIAPIVRPLLLAYFRSRRTVLGGSLSVIGTVASVTSTGRSSWEAPSRYRYA